MGFHISMISYNSGPLIEAALKSTYRHADHISVVDGSAYGPSTDGTVRLVANIGPKIKVTAGTFIINSSSTDAKRLPLGAWDEGAQRKVSYENLPKGQNEWVLIQDFDEAWDDANIFRLKEYISKADKGTWAFTNGAIHIWGDLRHRKIGGVFDMMRGLGCFRNVPCPGKLADVTRPLDDVKFFHYGHAMPRAWHEFKMRECLDRGDYISAGFKPGEWDKLVASDFFQGEYDMTPSRGVIPFNDPHPPEILEVAHKIWGEGSL
jgi:hypothetical protein